MRYIIYILWQLIENPHAQDVPPKFAVKQNVHVYTPNQGKERVFVVLAKIDAIVDKSDKL